MDILIDVDQVHKVYSTGLCQVHALDDISLQVHRGEFVAIIGNSGSGKSTLMNLLGCLDMPDMGKYYLSGKEVSRLSDDQLSVIRNQEIGFVFQGFNLIPGLNAAENVELPLMYRGLSRERRKLMALEALDKVGLSGRLHHHPCEMSGGQQQRVAIARALAAKPPLILADEPTGNLDSRSGEDVMAILSELWISGKTIILITHDENIALQAGRVVRIHDGKIVEDKIRKRHFTA